MSVVQKSPTVSLLSLPVEVREEVESHLQPVDQQRFFKALTTVTCNGDPVDSPTLKLYLLQQRIAPEYQRTLASADTSLRAFALHQVQRLWESGRLDQVVEKPAFFELVRLVDDPELFGYLREKIQQEPELKEKLLSWVKRSKTEEVQPMTANALTLLVKSGVQFNGADLRGIRIPGADLSYGLFDSAQLQGADLRKTNLRSSWLRQANLSGAQIASASQDNMVRLWDVASGQCRAVTEGFDRGVYSVVWKTTPDSTYLVIGSEDRLVRQWQVIEEGDEVQVRLWWMSPPTKLEVRATSIDDVEGLNELNRRLLKQLGAGGNFRRYLC